MTESRHVRTRFARAADRYDLVADFQRLTGEMLLAGLPPGMGSGLILDGGCGTGHGTALLRRRWPGAALLPLDFAYPMVARVDAILRVCADLHALPLRPGCLDGIWSNLALQWCDPKRFAREAIRVLRPGGWLALSTLGPDTFLELRQAFSAVDRYQHTIHFREPAEISDIFRQAGFSDVQLHRQARVLHYEAMGPLLAAVRDLGASRVTGQGRRSGLMGRLTWQKFLAHYERLRTEQGLPLRYDVICIHARRPAD